MCAYQEHCNYNKQKGSVGVSAENRATVRIQHIQTYPNLMGTEWCTAHLTGAFQCFRPKCFAVIRNREVAFQKGVWMANIR